MSSKLIILVFLGVASFLDSVRGESFGNGAYNSSCYPGTVDYDCDTTRGFLCNRETKRCSCYDDNQMEYNEITKRCHPYIGGTCYIMDSSTYYHALTCKDANAECVHDQGGWYPSGECVCKNTHIPSDSSDVVTPDKKCLPTYDLACDTENLPCHESTKLTCTNNVCQCSHPLSQAYDRGEKMCLGVVDMENSCDPAGGPLQCGSHAECGADGQCHCGAGWSADFSFPRECKLHHGQNCTGEGRKCNSDRGLKCMGGTCHCGLEPDVAFDEDKQICAVKKGFSCNLQNEAIDVNGRRTLLSCMTGLTCVKKGDHPHFGVCDN